MRVNLMDRFIDSIEWIAALFIGIVAVDVFITVLLRYFLTLLLRYFLTLARSPALR